LHANKWFHTWGNLDIALNDSENNNTQGRKEGRKFIILESISDKFVSLYNAPTRLEKVLEYFITVISWSFALFVKTRNCFWLCIIEHGLTKL
jgi:hypothetical protein